MKLTLDTYDTSLVIQAYEDNSVQIDNKFYNTSLILSPQKLQSPWRPGSIESLSSEDFQPVLALNPEIVILGTGKKLVFPATEILLSVYQKGLGIEIMDTAAACRTYNILVSENRKVAAALIL